MEVTGDCPWRSHEFLVGYMSSLEVTGGYAWEASADLLLSARVHHSTCVEISKLITAYVHMHLGGFMLMIFHCIMSMVQIFT